MPLPEDYVDGVSSVHASDVNAITSALNDAAAVLATVGAANGLAQLGADGLLIDSQRPPTLGSGTRVADLTMDFTIAADGAYTTAATGQAVTSSRVGSVNGAVASSRLINPNTSGNTAIYETAALSDAAQIIWFDCAVQIDTTGGGADEVPTMVMWESAMPSGAIGAGTNRSPLHLLIYRTGYVWQKYDSGGGNATNIASATYSSPIAYGAVMQLSGYIDTANDTVTITGADGVTRTHGPNAAATFCDAFYLCAEVYSTNAATDNPAKWLNLSGDSVIGGRLSTPEYQVQADDLDAIAALTPSNDDFLQRKAGVWTNRTPTQVKADLRPPRLSSTASTTSWTIDADATDLAVQTALAGALTVNAPSGTPVAGQRLMIRIKDNGTARAITWNSIFRPIGVTLPTTTVLSKIMYVGCIHNATDTKWDVIAVGQEA